MLRRNNPENYFPTLKIPDFLLKWARLAFASIFFFLLLPSVSDVFFGVLAARENVITLLVEKKIRGEEGGFEGGG